MAKDGEPEEKRMKLNSGDTLPMGQNSIQSILPDSLIKPLQYEKCVIAVISDKRDLCLFIQEINKAFPLPAFLHLKRANKGQIFLFPLSTYDQLKNESSESIQQDLALQQQLKEIILEKGFPGHLLANCTFGVAQVPSAMPQLKIQFQETIPRWPCKFREDKRLEKLVRNELFSRAETEFHVRMMKMCLEMAQEAAMERIALAYEPSVNKLVSLGWRSKDDSTLDILPFGHAVMRLIDNVAQVQGGTGAWQSDAGLEARLAELNTSFASFRDTHVEQVDEPKYGSYLCTGMDVYLSDEPCLMCAMALVHSRVRRIFYARVNALNGALGGNGDCGQLKLHGVKELNHHYDVFRINLLG